MAGMWSEMSAVHPMNMIQNKIRKIMIQNVVT